MSESIYDIAVIGGGIVGLATALKLTETGIRNLIVLEAEEKLAAHQTGNNSGVIHSGLYYKPGSLKASNCARGRAMLYRFCQEQGIAHERCGKLVIATSPKEIEKMDELEKRGIANGLQGLKRLGKEELREYEPHVAGIAGMLVPETGIVDYVTVCARYAELVVKAGANIRKGFRVTAIVPSAGEIVLESPAGVVRCRALINCAGLHSDRVARMAGLSPRLQIVPFRGEYYKLSDESRHLVRNLIYPVPDPRFPFLGVHFTRMIDGGVEAGPNAVLALKREGYSKTAFSLRDAASLFTYPGFWKMSLKYWKMGLSEMVRSFSKPAFVKALQRLIPEVESRHLSPGGAGVRAQALEPDGHLVDDFRILEAERMIHVLNAPSPAATASLSIGATIAEKALQNFRLK